MNNLTIQAQGSSPRLEVNRVYGERTVAQKSDFLSVQPTEEAQTFRIDAEGLSGKDYILEVESPYLTFLEVNYKRRNGRNVSRRFNLKQSYFYRFPTFTLSLPANKSRFFVRLNTAGHSQVHFSLLTKEQYQRQEGIGLLLICTVLFIITVGVFFLIRMGFKTQEKSFYYLSGAVFFSMLYILSTEGFIHRLQIWFDLDLKIQIQMITLVVFAFSYIRFGRVWLNAKRYTPTLNKIGLTLELMSLIFLILAFVSPSYYLLQIVYFKVLFTLFLVFILLILRRAYGLGYTKLALTGSYLGLIGFFLMILRLYGMISVSWINQHSVILGFAAQFIYLSISLVRSTQDE
ncbi:MAG: 7TM-DISM domain-containing protein [Bacteroidota bacterium]